jgi:hypothetical protein
MSVDRYCKKVYCNCQVKVIGRPILINGRPTVQITVDFCSRVGDWLTDPPNGRSILPGRQSGILL